MQAEAARGGAAEEDGEKIMRDEIITKMKEAAEDIFCHPELSMQETYSSRAGGPAVSKQHLPPSGAAADLSSDSLRNTMLFPVWHRSVFLSRRAAAVRDMDAGTIFLAAPVRGLRAR